VDRLAVRQCNDPQEPDAILARHCDPTPETDAAVLLDLAPQGGRDHVEAPVAPEIGALAQHLLLEIARRFHGRPPAAA